MRVVWTDAARTDLRGIREYIARDSPVFAGRVVEHIFRRADQLEAFPNSGRSVPEHGAPDVRELIEGAYRIIYLVGEEEVTILAVVHGARSLGG